MWHTDQARKLVFKKLVEKSTFEYTVALHMAQNMLKIFSNHQDSNLWLFLALVLVLFVMCYFVVVMNEAAVGLVARFRALAEDQQSEAQGMALDHKFTMIMFFRYGLDVSINTCFIMLIIIATSFTETAIAYDFTFPIVLLVVLIAIPQWTHPEKFRISSNQLDIGPIQNAPSGSG